MNFIIPILVLLPLFAGLAIFIAGPRGRSLVGGAVVVSLVNLLLSLLLAVQVSNAPLPEAIGTIAPRVRFVPEWLTIDLPISIGKHAVHWQLEFGADGIGALLVLLTGLVGFATVLLATIQIKERLEHYVALLLISQAMLMGVFLSMDLVSFYLFFEAVLLPLILLINGWGIRELSQAASRKFLIYTLVGSIPMVLGLIGLALQSSNEDRASTVSLPVLSQIVHETNLAPDATPTASAATAAYIAANDQWILWVLLLGFGIKLAVLPLHTWLPTTYAVSHPNTTALIAAVVAKLGVFGLIRIVIPLTPLAVSAYAQYLFGALGAFAIVYGAMVALTQSDMRRVLAYSSISHVGFITVGLMSLNSEGLHGAAIQMFNHGIITAAMFLLLAMLEQRIGPVSLKEQDRGLAAHFPKMGVLLVFFTLAGAGLPGLNGFVGELLAMTGMIRVSGFITSIAVLGTVLGAWYALRIVQRILFGSDGKTHVKDRPSAAIPDLAPIEWAPLVLLAALCVMIGLRPQDTMHLITNDVQRITKVTEPGSKLFHPDIDQLAKE